MERICYTGYGALPSGNHTQKQYMKVMNRHFSKECPTYNKSLTCDPCNQLKEIDKKLMKKLQKNDDYKLTMNERKKIMKVTKKCWQCKNKGTKKCNLQDYLSFSGAYTGKCKRN